MAKPMQIAANDLHRLRKTLKGELYVDLVSKILYSTDASAYREIPLGVALPMDTDDLHAIIGFAIEKNIPLIPRGAGTSLAGQVVGNGLVVDLSKYLNRIVELNAEERWVKVEPGVVLSDLNAFLKPHGLQFGPETSTANRCTMGGMLGNNSCGLHSLVYGSVREHILEVDAILSDNSSVHFADLDNSGFEQKCKLPNREGELYRGIKQMLGNKDVIKEIEAQYPDASVPRRNHGYALDVLAHLQPFNPLGTPFNFSKLLAGSEGTLAFVTSMKLNLMPLPPNQKALLCVHFHSLTESFHANLIGLKFNPSAIELMDKTIINLTKGNIGLQRNRFFIEGEPEAILILELWGETQSQINETAQQVEAEMRKAGYGYHFPLIWGADIPRVWALRTAGLGVLSNMPGDAKPVSVIEDTAVPVKKLPDYLRDFQQMLESMNLDAVYHAHIATGELHLRPILNLKEKSDVERFRQIATETARLVKKYRGSLSGEHGDGRLRGEFIPFMLGEKVFSLLKELKSTWDPKGIFNPGKITDTPAMNQSLRFEPGVATPELKTYFDYTLSQGYARAIERCNGSADCRKTQIAGGTMCPSYMATRNERHSTRGRANVLRELITRKTEINWADNHALVESLDLCLSCKACKSECPSGVDMAKLKAEFLQNHYDGNPVPIRTRLIANYPIILNVLSGFPGFVIGAMQNRLLSGTIKKALGFASQRPLPKVSSNSLNHWHKQNHSLNKTNSKTVYLFNDEFLNSTDVFIGIQAIQLLEKLGYKVVIPRISYSGRTWLSKGLVKVAQKMAIQNLLALKDIVTPETPLIGIEPSTLLSFRDEYPELVPLHLRDHAYKLAENTYLFDEFFMREVEAGRIKQSQFTTETATLRLHGHCHQKALTTTLASKQMLSFPANYCVDEIPSGCCGMAGSFGYEKEHYSLSMQIGELVLFPEIRKTKTNTLIVAPGTSCREQIMHGTGRKAYHPVEIMFQAMNK